MRLRLNRVLQQAVSHSLLGSLAACGGSASEGAAPLPATETNVTRPVSGEGPVSTPGSGSDGPTHGDGAPSDGAFPEPAETPANHGGVTSEGTTGEPAPEFQALPCLPEGESQFEHMLLARDYDYAALRHDTYNHLETDASGVACSGASDAPACLEQLATTWPVESGPWRHCVQLCVSSAVVLTVGDAVELIDSAEGVRQLLGNIDTPYEAALLARVNNFTVVCNETQFAPAQGGFTLLTREMVESCPVTLETFTLQVSAAGDVEVTQRVRDTGESSGVCIGRRPAGLVSSGRSAREVADGNLDRTRVGEFFAEVARLEASAVHAFRIMADELAALGAPLRLERAARRAARDEVRHAKLTSRWARRHGAEPRRPQVAPRLLRPLFELALENVVEGCVRETYGAACGRFQAARTTDSSLRGDLERVARDEARHAELSWRIHGWALQRLSQQERQRLQQAARTAIAELRRELELDPGSAVQQVAGMPAPEQALALLDCLEAELWSARRWAAVA